MGSGRTRRRTIEAGRIAGAVLGVLLKGKSPDLRPILIATVVLPAAGFVLTFPTFFQAFA